MVVGHLNFKEPKVCYLEKITQTFNPNLPNQINLLKDRIL